MLAAALFEAFPLRPSRKTFEAALAALAEVVSPGALLCVRALPAAVLEALLVDLLLKTFEAAFAAFEPVPFFMPFLRGARF